MPNDFLDGATPVAPASQDFLSGATPLPPAHQEALGLIDQARNWVDTNLAPKDGTHPVENTLLGAAHGVANMALHPVKTFMSGASAGNYPGAAYTGYKPVDEANANTSTTQPLVQSAADSIAAAKQNPAYAAGSVIGPMVATAGLAKGIEGAPDVGNALADRASTTISSVKTGASRLVPSLVDGPPESLITRAIKPGKNNVNWSADVQKALPQMKSAEAALGHPVQGVDDALQAANIAKKNIWQQYNARLGAAGQAGAVIDGNQIADAMMNSIDKRTAVQNPGLVARVQRIADTYRQPIPLDQAEDFLQSANKDLNSYYAKNKVGQNVAQNDPEISSTVAEANALRNGLYGKLDVMGGPGSAQLKQTYGSLMNMEKELYGRQLVAARQNPESLSEQLSTVRGAGKIAKGVLTASPGDVIEGAQNIAVSRALKARNTSDAMITRAFQKAQPATPFPPSQSPRFAGLLQRGPIEMQAPAQNGAPASQPPPFNYSTRAIRQGKLLPAQTGGPIELEYTPEMSGDERVAALMQFLRQHQQLGLPAKASPIPLGGGQ
jgi:hypothetical protein